LENNYFFAEHDSKSCPDKKQFKLDLVYLRMAKEWSTNSHCKRSQVGCLVVKDKTIISDGYNGTPTGFPNVCENELNETLPYVLHAEANAITKLAKNTVTSHGSTMYVTLSPCYDCSNLIIQSGIKRIVFCEIYRKTDSLELLNQAGIEIIYINLLNPLNQETDGKEYPRVS
jgi:dCMP deaminase